MFVNKFIKYIESERRLSKHTVTSYKTDLNQFFSYINDFSMAESVDEISFKIIRNWITYLFESGITSRTINRKISSLKSFFKFLEFSNLISVNPTLKIISPKNSRKLPSIVEQVDLDQLLDQKYFKNEFVGERDSLIIEFFYLTGLRLSELIEIKVNNIDFKNCSLKVIGKGNKERIVPLSFNLISKIEKRKWLIKVDFPEPLGPLSIKILGNFFFVYKEEKKLKSFSKLNKFREFLDSKNDGYVILYLSVFL